MEGETLYRSPTTRIVLPEFGAIWTNVSQEKDIHDTIMKPHEILNEQLEPIMLQARIIIQSTSGLPQGHMQEIRKLVDRNAGLLDLPAGQSQIMTIVTMILVTGLSVLFIYRYLVVNKLVQRAARFLCPGRAATLPAISSPMTTTTSVATTAPSLQTEAIEMTPAPAARATPPLSGGERSNGTTNPTGTTGLAEWSRNGRSPWSQPTAQDKKAETNPSPTNHNSTQVQTTAGPSQAVIEHLRYLKGLARDCTEVDGRLKQAQRALQRLQAKQLRHVSAYCKHYGTIRDCLLTSAQSKSIPRELRSRLSGREHIH